MKKKIQTYKNTQAKLLYFGKKLKLIEKLGKKCEICGEPNPFVLEFHHKDPSKKEFSFNKLRNSRLSYLEKEMKKCSLLCGNCHSELHYRYGRNGKDFEKLIFNTKLTKCSECGYSGKNFASLQFHHREPKHKKFAITSVLHRKEKASMQELNDEIAKCDILCSNCHKKKHTDIDFYTKSDSVIRDKMLNHKERHSKFNRDLIYKMYKSGMRQVDICKELGASKGTISPIIKEMKNNLASRLVK